MKTILFGLIFSISLAALANVDQGIISEVEANLSKAMYQNSVAELYLDEDVYKQSGTKDMARLAREIKRTFGCVNTTSLTNKIGEMKARQVRDMILNNCYHVKTAELALEQTVEIVSSFTPLTVRRFYQRSLLDEQILNNFVSGMMYGNLNQELKEKFGDCAHGAIWKDEALSTRELASIISLQCEF